MRTSIDFLRAFSILLRSFFPIWGGITVLITLAGLLLANLEGLSIGEGIYFAWVTGTTVGYGDLTPTSGASQFLAVAIAIMGILFTGIAVALALEAGKLSIQKNRSLEEIMDNVEEQMDVPVVRKRQGTNSR